MGQFTYENDTSTPVFEIIGDDGSFSLVIETNLINIVVNKTLDADSGYTQHVFMIKDAISGKGINVVINVLNVNDNAPRFSNQFKYFFITEPMFNGMVVGQVSAIDLDQDMITYSFNQSASVNDSAKFFIQKYTGIITPSSLAGDSVIDAEKSKSHTLYVLATDPFQLTGSIEVRILVFDINDNTNKFSQLRYTFAINENAEIGTVVGTVSSTDRDVDIQNAALSYYILSDVYSDIFTIDSFNGTIKVTGKIDFEVQQQYNLPVCAMDTQTLFADSRTNCTLVQINVTNLNDNPPKISPVNSFLTLSEKQVPFFIYQFLGTDADGSKPTFEFDNSLTSPIVRNLFKLDPVTGILRLNGTIFDYDDPDKVNQPYVIYVLVKDSEAPYQYGGTSRLFIGIKDTNDNSPVFVNTSYTFVVNENSVSGTFIGIVNATDSDKTALPLLYFELNNKYSEVINVDQGNGSLTVVGLLDHESLAYYYLTICASDQVLDLTQTIPSNEQRVGCSFVTIIINDTNDNLPFFENLSPRIKISEKSPAGLSVFQFFPKDKDDNSANQLQCILNTTLTTNSDASRFALDINTCVLTVSAVGLLDYEEQTEFHLYVNPYDGAIGTVSVLVIELIDTNDNSPKFSYPVYNFVINENAATNTSCGIVQAIDNDGTASNNQVIYFILTNQNIFGINSLGTIYVNGLVDYEVSKYYNLTVCASDNATDFKQTNPLDELRIGCAIVNIEVINLNDNRPVFNPPAYLVTIDEKVLIGTTIVKVTASDADGDTPKFVYNNARILNSTRSKFNLSETGEITLAGIIDFEEVPRTLVLFVYAVDSADNQVLATSPFTIVAIRISDVNDNSPTFSTVYYFSVNEHAVPGTFIGTVLANDPDVMNLTYFVLNQQNSDLFELNMITGDIRVSSNAKISYNELGYTITVCATDNYVDLQELSPINEKRTSCTLVTIMVVNMFDLLPKFIGSNYSIQVLDSTPNGKKVFQFFANKGDSSSISFAINVSKTNPEAMNLFALESDTGILFVNDFLTVAKQNLYVLYIIARDNFTLKSDDEAMLTINIVKDHDDFPLYSNTPFTFKFKESESIGYVLGSVYPTGSIATTLVFNILQSQYSDNFAVDNFGYLTLAKTVDYEAGVVLFTITVCATSSAGNY